MASGNDPAAYPRYRFGEVVVDATAHTLVVDGEMVAVEPKAYAVLLALLARAGALVGKDELLDAVWGHRHVTPGVLTRAIAQLRAAIGDDPHAPRYIQTQHGVGYRFVGELAREPGNADDAANAAAALPHASGDPRQDAAGSETHASRLPPARDVPHVGDAVADDAIAAHADDMRDGEVPVHMRPARLLPWLLAFLLVAGLLWWRQQQAPPPPREASIAVLPFTSLSTDPDDAYFAEGLAIELHDALAGVPGLTVAAPLSPRDSRRDGDLRRLGRDLGVSALLDASVRREGDTLRINARLTDARSGYVLWSRRYDRAMAQVFETQTSIAEEVVGSMLGAMPKQSRLQARLAPTRDAAAFGAYLRGLGRLLGRAEAGDPEQAASEFRAALEADPGFARAQAGVCRSDVDRFLGARDPGAYETARAACAQARRMDPGLSEVDLAMGDLLQARGDLDAAAGYYRRAERDPARRPSAYVGLAQLSAAQGHQAQAFDYFRRALRLQPGNANIHAHIGYQHYLAGQFDQAIAEYRRSVELAPEDADTWTTLGGLYLTVADGEAAAAALQRSIDLKPGYAALSNLGELRFQQGRYREAAALQRSATGMAPSDYLPWNNLGDALLADGDAEGAATAYREAATQVSRYLQVKSDDAKALAALGWFRANLDESAQARDAARRSEALDSEVAEVAMYNAQTYLRVGDNEQARRRIADARTAGMPESRLAGNPFLAKAGVVAR